jgi:hypothetical protein
MRGTVGIVLIALWALPAAAATTEELAAAAEEAHSSYCADGARGDINLTSQSVARVGDVWQRVTEAGAGNNDPFLLYWRAKLAECLNHEEFAQADYAGFLTAVGKSPLYTAMAKDAERRLRRLHLRARQSRNIDSTPAFAVSGLLAGGAAAFGAGAGHQWTSLLDGYAQMQAQPLSEDQYSDRLADLAEFEQGHQGLLLATMVSGGSAVAVFVISAATHNRPRAGARAAVVPTPGGLLIAGRF